jgi:hypothetical protein
VNKVIIKHAYIAESDECEEYEERVDGAFTVRIVNKRRNLDETLWFEDTLPRLVPDECEMDCTDAWLVRFLIKLLKEAE